MRKSKPITDIHAQNREILQRISSNNVVAARTALRAEGHRLFADVKDSKKLKKIGWDLYQFNEEPDAGAIWSLESISGEDWLVCHTDKSENILRGLSNKILTNQAQQKQKIQKKATIMTPGDLVKIVPLNQDSINYKYKDRKGTVTAAMPDRSALTFDDGSSLWIENKDLVSVQDSKEIELGDSVRMFSNQLKGTVVKLAKNAVQFQDNVGQIFSARLKDIVLEKKGITLIQTDPNNPDDTKQLREIYKGWALQNQGDPALDMLESVGDGEMEVPPSIKANPSQQELQMGTAQPASNFLAADLIGFVKEGRTLNIGDMVQKKSTGQSGVILDAQFDKKLGKYYLIDYGAEDPTLEYDTDIMKTTPSNNRDPAAMPGAIDYNEYAAPAAAPAPSQIATNIAKREKIAELNSVYDGLKPAALEFVLGMRDEAITGHEAASEGKKLSTMYEQALVKQAITTYMKKYLPPAFQQVMSADDKNALSGWLFEEATRDAQNVAEKMPTAIDFDHDGTNKWDLAANRTKNIQTLALKELNTYIASHNQVTNINPMRLARLSDKEKFTKDAALILRKAGIEPAVSDLLVQRLITTGKIHGEYLDHVLTTNFGYAKKVLSQITDTALDALGHVVFSTAANQKFALDLPGMETLRGGGGGYPGGMDIDPMGWQVSGPGKEEGPGMDVLENALQENLTDQMKPFEEAAPKINIELDPTNDRIVIDYGQEEESPITLDGAPGIEGEMPPADMPGSAGAGQQPGGAAAQDASNPGNPDLPQSPISF